MTETVTAPPTDADPLLAAEVELQDRLDAADRIVRDRFDALETAVEGQVVEPLQALIREAAATHRRAIETHIDTLPTALAEDLDAAWEAVTAYRRDTTAVHERVTAALREYDLGATLGALYTGARTDLATLADDVPEVIVREEPEGLVEMEAGDSSALIARKLAERARRGLRAGGRAIVNGLRAVVRKPRHAPAPYTQVVPIRELLSEHTDVRLARAFNDEHERVQAAAGQAAARLEAALATWTTQTLRAEARLDQPRFHTDAVPWPTALLDPSAAEAIEYTEASAETALDPVAPSGQAEEQKTLDDTRNAVRAVRETAAALDDALSDLPVAPTPHDPTMLDALRDALGERVRRSGYDSDTIALPGEDPDAALATGVTKWTAWHHHVVERLDVDDLLLTLRERLVQEVDVLIESVVGATVHPVREATHRAGDALEALKKEAAAACAKAEDTFGAGALAETLRDLLDRTLRHVDRDLLSPLQSISLDRASERAIAAMRQRLTAFVATIPERLTLFVRLPPERAGQAGPTAEVELRKIVGGLLTDEFSARLLKSTEVLRQPLFRAVSDAEGVRDVVRYNVETAIEELEAVAASGERGEIVEAIANARELTVDGLTRSADQLATVEAPLDAPLREFVERATETFERGWETLRQRTNAQNLVEAQFLDFKTRVIRATERTQRTLQEGVTFAEQKLRTFFRFGRREARRLVQLGQAAAGLAAQSASDRQRTLDALATASTLHANLPLVYRRLFAFGPTSDPSLFVNRTVELARVTRQYERWSEGKDSSALVIRASAGAGRTSFINVLEATVLDGVDVAHAVLSGRLTTDDELARLLADALGFEPNTARTLDMLETTILAEDPGPKRVCVVERIEHLILRAPGGLDLLERALIFFSRTDSRVFWVITAIESGWTFVERSAPQITGLVDAVQLPPLTRDEIEELLMRRHRRSGLPLRFAEPEEPSTLLARRLGKTKTDEERQDILRGDFFDGLYRASGPHPLLALLYWLRSADFEAKADTLTLRPVRPLDFGFIAQFDLPRAFALKALLQHGSLTLDEHDRVFRTTREESFLLFESLHNLRLIRRVHNDGAGWATGRNGQAERPETVHEEARYQLHPLAVAPVAAALRTRNML